MSGVALIIGAPLTAISVALGDWLISINPENIWLMYLNPVSVIGSMFVLLGLPGLYARQASLSGGLGLIGFVLLFFAGMVMGVGGGTLNTFFPSYTDPPTLNIFLSLLFSVAAILFGMATMTAGVLPRLAGLLLIIAGLGTGLENLVHLVPGIMQLDVIVTDVSGALFMLGIAWFGFALLSQPVANGVNTPTP